MDKPTIKILMLKGEKGDAYDDSELRAEIEATLANNAYVQFIGDGELELPVHTINDSVTSNTSTWSSTKITSEISALIDDSETSNESTWSSNKITDEISTIINDDQTAEDSETTTVSAHKLFGVISQINQNIDGIYNDVQTIKPKTDRVFNYNATNAIEIDTSKFNHLMVITSNRLILLTLNGLSGTIGITPLVGNSLTAVCVQLGNYLTIAFDNTQISSFCYMLTN